MGAATLLLALAIYAFHRPLIRVVYMHGKFHDTQLNEVAAMLPPWIGYFVVMSLNAIAARYLFTGLKGTVYVRHMLCAYAAANLLRFLITGQLTAPSIVWCSVAAEAGALAVNLRSCFAGTVSPERIPALAGTTSAVL